MMGKRGLVAQAMARRPVMVALRAKMEAGEAVPLPFRRPPGDDDRPWALPRGWDGRGGGPAEEGRLCAAFVWGCGATEVGK